MASVIAWIVSAIWSLVCLPSRIVGKLLGSGDEAYSSLDHVALNVKRPETEWMNMGNWAVSAYTRQILIDS
jgi:hypothetical protein